MANYRLAFRVGRSVPFYTKKGVWKFVKLRSKKQADYALNEFLDVAKHFTNKKMRTSPHPVTPELDKRNCNQRTVNKIAGLVNKMKLTPQNAHIK